MSEIERDDLPLQGKVDDDDKPTNSDFVIRDGFPALRLPGGKEPWIEGDEPLPRHLFWARGSALDFHPDHLDALRRDCETVFSARERDQDQPYSAGITYFCPSQMTPRCALEALALSIFHQHTQHLEPGVMVTEQSGAEWWTLVLDDDKKIKAVAKPTNDDDDDDDDGDVEEDEGDEVGLHFDADYGLEDQAPNLLLHPRVGTVTYLTCYGAPTVVFDKRSPPPDDPDKKTLNGSIRRGWISHPDVGKHLSFDGRLLHGAPATFFPPRDLKTMASDPPPNKRHKVERKRITVLVNVWVNHCPLDAELLDDDVCESLQSPFNMEPGAVEQPCFSWRHFDFKTPAVCYKVNLVATESNPAGEEEFVLCGHLVTAKYGASMDDLHTSVNQGDLIELDLASGVLSLEVGARVEDATDGEESGSDDE